MQQIKIFWHLQIQTEFNRIIKKSLYIVLLFKGGGDVFFLILVFVQTVY